MSVSIDAAAAQNIPINDCRYTRLPEPERPHPRPLPRAVCLSVPVCKQALADYKKAFGDNEKAEKQLQDKQAQILKDEYEKPATQNALKKIKEIFDDLQEAENKVDLAGYPINKLGDANAENVLTEAPSVELPAEKFLKSYNEAVGALQTAVSEARGKAAELLSGIGSLVEAARSRELLQLQRNVEKAKTCLTRVKDAAKEAGLDVDGVKPPTGQRRLPTGASVNIQSAWFGELAKKHICDALPKVKVTCQFSQPKVYRDTGIPIPKDELRKVEEGEWEHRILPVKGDKPACSLSKGETKAMCGAGDGPGQPGKQQLRVTWTCDSSSKELYCKTWNAGEEAIIICDGTDNYAESETNVCDPALAAN